MEEHNILVFLRPRRLESGVRVRGRNVSPRNYRVSGTWSYDFSAINPVYDNGAGVIKRTTHSSIGECIRSSFICSCCCCFWWVDDGGRVLHLSSSAFIFQVSIG